MSDLQLFRVWVFDSSLRLEPHNEAAKLLVGELRKEDPDSRPLLACFSVKASGASNEKLVDADGQRIVNAERQRQIVALKAGATAAVQTLMSAPVDSAEAERRLMIRWEALANNTQPAFIADEPTLAAYIALVSGFTANESESEGDKQKLDILAAIWLLRRARDHEEMRRHATLVLDGITAAANGGTR